MNKRPGRIEIWEGLLGTTSDVWKDSSKSGWLFFPKKKMSFCSFTIDLPILVRHNCLCIHNEYEYEYGYEYEYEYEYERSPRRRYLTFVATALS